MNKQGVSCPIIIGRLKKIIDAMAALQVFLPLIFVMVVRSIFRKKPAFPSYRKMLVIDTAYTLEIILKRQLEESITCRDLDGYFEHVWSCHPCATVIPPEKKEDTYGSIVETELALRHTFMEGKVGRYPMLERWPTLNFILSQWHVYFYLNRLIEREKITVIRVGEHYPALIGVALAGANGLPLAIRVTVNYDEMYATTGRPAAPRLFKWRWVEKIVEKFLFSRADLIVGPNQNNLNFALANGGRPEVGAVFRYGNLIHSAHYIQPDKRKDPSEILAELGLLGRDFSFTISRLEKMKRPGDIIWVISEAKKRGYNLAALIAGDGSMADELKRMAKEMGVEKDVIFAGNRQQEWLATVLPAACIVISPFMGRALTEAALAAKPIVAYDIDWQAEVIKSGETGELVEFGDWRSMAERVIKYLDNPEYAAHMGENVNTLIKEMMDPVKLNNHERKEYDKLFKRFHGTTPTGI